MRDGVLPPVFALPVHGRHVYIQGDIENERCDTTATLWRDTMTVRWGVIGAGGVAKRRTIPEILKARDATLSAVMVRDQARADELAAEFGANHAFSDWRELLKCADVDAVHVATPVNLHREQVIAAAESGKHVMCDKPMAMSAAECSDMIAACKANDVHLQVCFLMRFGSIYRKLKQMISDGRFGDIIEARATIFKGLPIEDDAWRVKKELGGGGPLMDLGAHTIDLLTYLTGPVKSAYAVCMNRASTWNVEDSVSVLMRSVSGAACVVGHSFKAPGGDSVVEIQGTLASAQVATPPGTKQAVLRIADADGATTEPVPFENFYQLQAEHFADCLAGKAEPIAPGEAGLHNMAVIEAAYLSCETGKAEEIPA
jgi:predicted dehydrogenase